MNALPQRAAKIEQTTPKRSTKTFIRRLTITALAITILAMAIMYPLTALPAAIGGAALGALITIEALAYRLGIGKTIGITPLPVTIIRSYDEAGRLIRLTPPRRLSAKQARVHRALYADYAERKRQTPNRSDEQIAFDMEIDPRTLSVVKQNHQLGLLN